MSESYSQPLHLDKDYGFGKIFRSRETLVEGLIKSWKSLDSDVVERIWAQVTAWEEIEDEISFPPTLERAIEEFHRKNSICYHCKALAKRGTISHIRHSMVDTMGRDNRYYMTCLTSYRRNCLYCTLSPIRPFSVLAMKFKRFGICQNCKDYKAVRVFSEISCFEASHRKENSEASKETFTICRQCIRDKDL